MAKKFVAAQGLSGSNGVLVLSEFAGVALEPKKAHCLSTHGPIDLANTLARLGNDSREARRATA